MNMDIYTFPIRLKMYSMMIDTESKTKQTTATAQVGVSSKFLPPFPPILLHFPITLLLLLLLLLLFICCFILVPWNLGV